MRSSEQPFQVVIVGSGLAAASAAAALASALPTEGYAVSLVDSPAEDDPDEVAAIQQLPPLVRSFHSVVGIGEGPLLAVAGGSFSLGIALSGWSDGRASTFFPFGDIGVPLFGLPFPLVALRARGSSRDFSLSDFCMATVLAQTGRFQRPSADPRSPLSSFSYGLHVERDPYSKLLFDAAERSGAQRCGQFAAARRGSPGIEAVCLDDGREIRPDLVVDASGPARRAISALEHVYEPWSDAFGFDRAAGQLCASDVAPAPYAHVEAIESGWRATTPGRRKLGEVVAFDSGRTTDEDIEALLATTAYGTATAPARFVSCNPGRLRESWIGNCVAVGSASCVIEPASGESAQLVHSALARLLTLLSRYGSNAERLEYNRLTSDEIDCARDFAAARYLLNGRKGEAFWDERRAATASGELRRKVDSFSARGRVPLCDGDRWDEEEWAALFDSLEATPARLGALAGAIPPAEAREKLRRVRELMIRAAASVPTHAQFLATLASRAAA